MKCTLHRLVTLLFVFVFVYNYIGAYFVFEAHHEQLARAFFTQASIPSNAVNIIRIKPGDTNSQLLEGGRELVHLGHMYDVVRSEHQGKDVIVYCLSDSQEDLLIASMETQFNSKNTAGDHEKNRSVPTGISFEKFIPQASSSAFSDEQKNSVPCAFEARLQTAFYTALTPPPETCVS